MIRKGTKEVGAAHYQNNSLTAIYKGVAVIWEAIKSCFGAGYWVDEKTYLDDEPYKD